MSKKTKKLIVMAGLLVVLLAVYAGITFVNHKKEQQAEKEAKEAENGFLVKEMEASEIKGFSYQHFNSDEFSDTKYIFSKQGDNWYYKADTKFPVNQTVAQTKVEDLSKVYAKRLLEKTDENFETYGLDKPALTLSVTDGKETVTYHIGNYNESTADYYMNIEGTKEVYTVDGTLWTGFAMELYDMVEMEKFPEIQIDHITHVNIKTAKEELDFTFEVTGTETEERTEKVTKTGEWTITDGAGNKVKANSSKTNALMTTIVGMSYVQEVNYNCEEDQLAAYGMDSPGAVITIDYTVDQVDYSSVEQVELEENLNEIAYETTEQKKQLVVTVGNTTDTFAYTDDYYVKTSQGNAILTIEAATAEMFMTLERDSFIAKQTIAVPTEGVAE